MKLNRRLVLSGLLASALGVPLARCVLRSRRPSPEVGAFIEWARRRYLEADERGPMSFAGRDGRHFTRAELRFLGSRRFWGKGSEKNLPGPAPNRTDPFLSIVRFLKRIRATDPDVELLVLPVPPALAIYPDVIYDGLPLDAAGLPPRVDPYFQEFLPALEDAGVLTVDLVPAFRSRRNEPLFPKYDYHWASRAMEIAAQVIAERMQDRPWVREMPKRTFEVQESTKEVAHTLLSLPQDQLPPPEKIPIRRVLRPQEKEGATAPNLGKSPVAVIGDSFANAMHPDAGLPDHLTRFFGFPVDMLYELHPARGSVAPGQRLPSKKLVVWCFSATALTGPGDLNRR